MDTTEAVQLETGTAKATTRAGLNQVPVRVSGSRSGLSNCGAVFTTFFGAIRTTQGITPISDLTAVQVTRKQAVSAGGGRIHTKINFLDLIRVGEQSQIIGLSANIGHLNRVATPFVGDYSTGQS